MPDQNLQATYRILDASANRAGEGLRTAEEFVRFVLDDAGLTGELKSLRHDLATAIGRMPREALLSARDTQSDVGTSISESTEYTRGNFASVVAAATTRTTQSLRVLEEYGKTIDAAMALQIEQIRYRAYTTFAKLELASQSDDRRARIDEAKLYVLIDAGPTEEAFCATVRQLAAGAVDVFQLRDRSCDDRTLIARARAGTQIAREVGKLFIMNDRADLALAADTDGVHVGQEELPAEVARRIVGGERLVGVSTHSIAQARAAVADGADYIGCGPVFAGRTKAFDEYVGTNLLECVNAEIDLPSFAIGGIDSGNVEQLVAVGCRRIAVTGAVRDAEDPIAAAATLKQQLQS